MVVFAFEAQPQIICFMQVYWNGEIFLLVMTILWACSFTQG